MSFSIIEDGHISTPAGFRATGVSCGLKEVRARDIALVYSTQPCRTTALFTQNKLIAAPVFFSQAVLARNSENIRAVLINAGHANAGTGQQGLTNAIESAKIAADELEVPRDSVLLMSTGQIGVQLPMDRMRDGIRRASSELDSGAGRRAALAILTTDTKPKDRALRVNLREGRSIILAGMAKGGRMTYPRLATLLCVITTDALIDTRLMAQALGECVSRSFGSLILDGDTSPNDSIVLMSNGVAGNTPIVDKESWDYSAWKEGLEMLCQDLSQQIIRDAADKAKSIQIQVRGATSDEHARQVASAVARSSSVRLACARGSADWGSIMVAVGASDAELRPDILEIRVGQITVMIDGSATRFDHQALLSTFSGAEIELTIDLHMGTNAITVHTITSLSELV